MATATMTSRGKYWHIEDSPIKKKPKKIEIVATHSTKGQFCPLREDLINGNHGNPNYYV